MYAWRGQLGNFTPYSVHSHLTCSFKYAPPSPQDKHFYCKIFII